MMISAIRRGAAVVLAAMVAFTLTGPAMPDSLVRTKEQCTRYSGKVSRHRGDPAYPYSCATPRQDRECRRKHGEGWYFDAEYGRCEEEWDDWEELFG